MTKHRDKEALNVLCKIQSSGDKVEAFFNLETLQETRDKKRVVQNSFSLFMKRKYICRQVIKLDVLVLHCICFESVVFDIMLK